MADAATLYPVVRGFILLAVLLLIGTGVATRLATSQLGSDAPVHAHVTAWHSRLPGLLAWFLLTLSLARGILQVLSFTFPGEPVEIDLVRAVLLEGTWGTSWLLQTSAAFVLLAGSWILRQRRTAAAGLLLVATVAIMWAQTGMGHANEDFWPGPIGRVVDFAHLLGGGIWLGTLTVLTITTFPVLWDDTRVGLLAGVVRRFSTVARVGAALLVGSGIVAAWQYVGSIAALFSTTYGWLVTAKIVLFLLIAALGWWNWKVVTPMLGSGGVGASRRLRRAVVLELAIGAVVVGLTAVLVGTTLPITP